MQFSVSFDHPCLPGHFPGHPVVPGVLLLDRVLDAIKASGDAPVDGLRLPRVKFMQPLLPGEVARIELEGAMPRWKFRVLRGESLLASGEVAAGPHS